MERDDRTQTEDPLAEMLARFEADSRYVADEVLKENEVERTERVHRVSDGGLLEGPFVRKHIAKGSNLGQVYRLLYEAQEKGARLAHIPRIVECAEIGDRLVVVMEHVAGQTLATCVEARHSAEERLALAQQAFPELCDAVEELHTALAEPIVHRDITPTNVMVGRDAAGRAAVTLIDFGISRVYKPQADRDTAYLGTRPYAPPEQCGFGQTSVQTDVYALGAVLFFCLTGRAMCNHDRLAHYDDPAVPADLRRVIAKACALDAQDRYASARDLKWAFGVCPSARPSRKASPAATVAATSSSHTSAKTAAPSDSPTRPADSLLPHTPAKTAASSGSAAFPTDQALPHASARTSTPSSPIASPTSNSPCRTSADSEATPNRIGSPIDSSISPARASVAASPAARQPDAIPAEPSPRGPLAACRAFLRRLPEAIPTWVCRVWNAFVALNWVAYSAASWFTVSQALPEDIPFWLDRCYAVFYVVFFTSIAFVLYDKRRLYARLNLKHDKTLAYQAIRCVLILLTAFLVLLALHVVYSMQSR